MKKILFGLFCVGVAGAFANNTAHNGQDFTVFWVAAKSVLEHGTAYSIERDGFMSFKYPPWILPFFIPFGFFSLEQAKWIWGLIEAGSLLYAVRFCLSHGARYRAIVIALLLFWPLWNVHGFDGQISIVLTALMLLGYRTFQSADQAFGCFFAMAFGLSAKIFTLFPILAIRWNRSLIVKSLLILLLALVATGLAIGLDSSGLQIVSAWLKAAGPGYNAQGELTISVAGFQSQGIPSLLFRVFAWPGDRMGLLYGCVLILGAASFFVLKKIFSKDNRSVLVWSAWMAATATLQPLAGFHVFVMAFPLAVLVLNQRPQRIATWIAIACVTLITEKLGTVGHALQFVSVKSIGVWSLIAIASLNEEDFRFAQDGN